MRKAIIITSVIIIVSFVVAYRAVSFRSFYMNENIEALMDPEVDTGKLKRMFLQPIWEVRLVYDPQKNVTDTFCVSEGSFVCPIQ